MSAVGGQAAFPVEHPLHSTWANLEGNTQPKKNTNLGEDNELAQVARPQKAHNKKNSRQLTFDRNTRPVDTSSW